MISKNQLIRGLIFVTYPIVRILSRPITKRYLTVFLFHDVTDTPSNFQIKNSNYTSTQNFKRNIEWINDNYKVIDISQIADLDLTNNKPLALITFDDAWKGQVWASKYVSSEYGIPITLFINFGTVKSKIDIAALRSYGKIPVPDFEKNIELPDKPESSNVEFLNWQGEVMTLDEITEIDLLSNSTLANHCFHHYPAIELSQHEFLENVEMNEKDLSKLTSFKRYFAFPFGRPGIDFKEDNIELLKSISYEYIFSADAKLNQLPLRKNSTLSRINFSPTDSKKSDFWWATNKSLVLRRS